MGGGRRSNSEEEDPDGIQDLEVDDSEIAQLQSLPNGAPLNSARYV